MGAGRKPLPPDKRLIAGTIRLTKDQWTWLKSKAVSGSGIIRSLIKAEMRWDLNKAK